MHIETEKCVMILDENLPRGIIANAAAILGITMGKKKPEIVGIDVADREGNQHSGIIQFPVPILKGTAETLKQIRGKLFSKEYADLTVVDFTDLARGCKTYKMFTEKMAVCAEKNLSYLGIAVCGDKKKVNALTGNMPLLR